MKVFMKMLVQLDPRYRHSYGKYPQHAFQSKHKVKMEPAKEMIKMYYILEFRQKIDRSRLEIKQ